MKKAITGFTIVELLIVIVVIAILAAISVVAYNGIQARAQEAKIETDLTTLEKAIRLAQVNSGGLPLSQITGELGTGSSCWGLPAGTNLATLPKTNGCWTVYATTLEILSQQSGMNLAGLVDPWGYPYMIDENEGEVSSDPCRTDDIGTYFRPAGGGYDASVAYYREVAPIGAAC